MMLYFQICWRFTLYPEVRSKLVNEACDILNISNFECDYNRLTAYCLHLYKNLYCWNHNSNSKGNKTQTYNQQIKNVKKNKQITNPQRKPTYPAKESLVILTSPTKQLLCGWTWKHQAELCLITHQALPHAFCYSQGHNHSAPLRWHVWVKRHIQRSKYVL